MGKKETPDYPTYSEVCRGCPLWKKGLGQWVPPRMPPPGRAVKYIVVGEAPGETEVTAGEPFCGKTGSALREEVRQAGIDLDDVLIVNTMLCAPRKSADSAIGTPTPKTAQLCSAHAWALIEQHQPEAVFAVGAVAMRALTGRGGILSKHGQTLYLVPPPGSDVSRFQMPCYPIIHPSYYMRSGSAVAEIREDLRSALASLSVESSAALGPTQYRVLGSLSEVERYVDETIALVSSGRVPVVAVDIETTAPKSDDDVWKIPFDKTQRILSVQFSRWPGDGALLYLSHRETPFAPADFPLLVRNLKRFFDGVPIVGHGWGYFDALVLLCKLGLVTDHNVLGDTMLMHHWLRMGLGLPNDLDSLGARYLASGGHKLPAHRYMKQNRCGLEDLPEAILLQYGCGDTDVTLRLFYHFQNEMVDAGVWEQYRELFHGRDRACAAFSAATYYGLQVDERGLSYLETVYPTRLQEVYSSLLSLGPVQSYHVEQYRKYCVEVAAHNTATVGTRCTPKPALTFDEWVTKNAFNPNSPPQTIALWKYFQIPFGRIPEIEYGKTGGKPDWQKPKTDSDNRERILAALLAWAEEYEAEAVVLEQRGVLSAGLAEAHLERVSLLKEQAAVFRLLGEYKEVAKQYSTYVKAIRSFIVDVGQSIDVPSEYVPHERHPAPMRLHPAFLFHTTSTSRTSSKHPNAQNFSQHGIAEEYDIRIPYVSGWWGRGGVILAADYSQMEVRIAVIESGDDNLAQVIARGEDIHTYVATQVYNKEKEHITKAERTAVKSVTFGLLYGQTEAGLATTLGITVQAAKDLMDLFFSRMPKFADYVARVHKAAVEDRRWVTRFGRIRHYPDLASLPEYQRSEYLRQAVNMPIQSTASDLTVSAFGRAWRVIQAMGIEAHPWNEIHDSLLFDVRTPYLWDLVEVLHHEMVVRPHAMWPWLTCPIVADFSVGVGWAHLVDLELVRERVGGEYSHTDFVLLGKESSIQLVLNELPLGTWEVGSRGPHPKAEEAEKGKQRVEIRVERPEPLLCVSSTSVSGSGVAALKLS